MKTRLAIVFFVTLCAGSVNIARAVCVGASVNSFGAKGDGHSDDTAAIQKAINAAGSAGGGSVMFNVARYFTSGTLIVPPGVVLCGAVEGPFDVTGVNPALTTIAPTILVTNTSGPFLTVQGGNSGAGVTDLLFHYPNQVASTAAAPTVYPFTILVTTSGKVARCTVTNAYSFLDIEVGQVIAQDLFIGAFKTGIKVDNAGSRVTLRNIQNQVFWDTLESATYPRPIDSWVLSNGTALLVNRADSLEVHNFSAFSRFAGIVLNASGNCATAMGSNIDLDKVQYGIVVATACTVPGSIFTNVDIAAAPGLGQAAVQVPSGGSLPPKIEINGGSQRGPWAIYAYPPAAPDLIILNILP